MKILIINESGTIFKVEGHHTKPTFIGEFNPVLLKEWVEMILDEFGTDPVYLYSYGSYDPAVTNKVLAASVEHKDEVHIDVVGVDCDDVKER